MNVEWENKINLTAALRMAARLDLHEGVDNHFSLMVSDKPFRFLLNPNRRHWSQLRASELVEVDESGKPINDSEPPERRNGVLGTKLKTLTPKACQCRV